MHTEMNGRLCLKHTAHTTYITHIQPSPSSLNCDQGIILVMGWGFSYTWVVNQRSQTYCGLPSVLFGFWWSVPFECLPFVSEDSLPIYSPQHCAPLGISSSSFLGGKLRAPGSAKSTSLRPTFLSALGVASVAEARWHNARHMQLHTDT